MKYIFPLSYRVYTAPKTPEENVELLYEYQADIVAKDRDEAASEFARIMGLPREGIMVDTDRRITPCNEKCRQEAIKKG